MKEEKITCAKALVKTLREFKVDEDEIVTRLMKEFSMRNLRIRLERGRLFGGGKSGVGYRGMGRRISQEFKEYIKEVNEQALEGLR